MNNITFKKSSYGYTHCYIAYHNNGAILDYIFILSKNNQKSYKVGKYNFKSLEGAQNYIIEKLNSIPK